MKNKILKQINISNSTITNDKVSNYITISRTEHLSTLNLEDKNKNYKYRKNEKCINNVEAQNNYDNNNYLIKKKKENLYNNNIINFNNNNGYNYNNINLGNRTDKQYNNFYSERNDNRNYYNNMNINKGYIYKNNSTPKMIIPKESFSPENKKYVYQNYNKNYKLKDNKENIEEFSNQNNYNINQKYNTFNDASLPVKKNIYKSNNYNNNKNINHRQKSANTLNTINF